MSVTFRRVDDMKIGSSNLQIFMLEEEFNECQVQFVENSKIHGIPSLMHCPSME